MAISVRQAHRVVLLLLMVTALGCAEKDTRDSTAQYADTLFVVPGGGVARYTIGKGPNVGIDEAHHNYHTAEGRYLSFTHLLQKDGYTVSAFSEQFSDSSLDKLDVLVISNALSEEKQFEWSLPTPPAFTSEEVANVEAWVAEGGRLMLIADHMPFPGAARELAFAFGIVFHDGYAYTPNSWDNKESQLVFSKADGLLSDHLVTRPQGGGEVPFVVTFTGQGFRLLRSVSYEPLIRLPDDSFLLLPEKAYDFDQSAPQIPGAGLLQGALVRFGKGRVAVFGEAAMFSAQIQVRKSGPFLFGMNSPDAPHNARFLLNVMGWLTDSVSQDV